MSSLISLPLRCFRPRRYRPGGLGTWTGHLPFANDLVHSLRPALFVELGTHFGESYFGFCQAIEDGDLACRCVAVDTWKGDEHAGFYDDAVFEEVSAYNASHYAAFSTLLRSTFALACEQFAENSIDLLHIDGLHTFEAVKQDFETWFPKVKPGGVVLLHDVGVRHADFEVWRFWEELASRYPTFEFHHWWGLGVLRKPGGSRESGGLLNLLWNADDTTAERIRQSYENAAELLECRERKPQQLQAAAEADRPYLQIFPGNVKTGFTEAESIVLNLEPGTWQTHTIELQGGASIGLIRIDPVNRPASIQIEQITLQDIQGTAAVALWTADSLELPFADGLLRLSSGEAAFFLSWGNDPRFVLQLPKGTDWTAPLRLTIVMRVSFTFEPVVEAFEAQHSKDAERKIAEAEISALKKDLLHEQHRRIRLEWDHVFEKSQHKHLRLTLRQLRADAEAKNSQFEEASTHLADTQARVADLTASFSWKVTAPLRALARTLRQSISRS